MIESGFDMPEEPISRWFWTLVDNHIDFLEAHKDGAYWKIPGLGGIRILSGEGTHLFNTKDQVYAEAIRRSRMEIEYLKEQLSKEEAELVELLAHA